MLYRQPILINISHSYIADGGCGNGEMAGEPACFLGTEATGLTGCGSGAAAVFRCVSGAAASSSCNVGEGNGTAPIKPLRKRSVR